MVTLVGNRIRVGILATLAAPQLLIGLWAVLAPRNWYDTFPGIDPRLVAVEPPFNAHLATDAGAGFFAAGIALAVAAVWGHRAAIQIALVAYVGFALPHLVYHATHPAPLLNGLEDLLNVVMLASGPALAGFFAWRARLVPVTVPASQPDPDDQAPEQWRRLGISHEVDRRHERTEPDRAPAATAQSSLERSQP